MVQVTETVDLVAAFKASPNPYALFDADLRFVDMNAAYLELAQMKREAMIGNRLFDIFHGRSAAESSSMAESLSIVLKTGKSHSLSTVFYPQPSKGADGRIQKQETFWQMTHSPVLNASGQVTHILQQPRDVTQFVSLTRLVAELDPSTHPAKLLSLDQDAYLKAATIQADNLRLSNERSQLLDMFMQAPGFVAIMTGPELRVQMINAACAELLGHRPVVGLPLGEALPELAAQGFKQVMEDVYTTGHPYQARRTSVWLTNPSKNQLEARYLDFMYQPLRNPSGKINGVFVQGHDVSDLVHADQRQKLMIDELNHRVKNTLATVQSIAMQTARSHQDPASFAETFQARILALSHTHDLLTQSLWEGADLADVIHHEMAAYGTNRLRLDGPTVALDPNTAVSLGMIFHELATNAAKYGALTPGLGHVDVSWEVVDDGERLNLTWSEKDGPPASVPKRRGFGSRLIERNVRHDLSGQVETYFTQAGFRARFSIPLTKDGQ